MVSRINVWGELQLRDAAGLVALPKSRKTRALFAYLLLEQRPIRRETLCDIFWELPDDPRGSLRWSLSKIRKMLGDDAAWLVADHERVSLEVPDQAVDMFGVPGRPRDRDLLDGIDLHNNERFTIWLADQRRRVEAIEEVPADPAPFKISQRLVIPPAARLEQRVHYTQADDGTRIAYACTGSGPRLLKAANWLGHLDYDLAVPLWGRMFAELSEHSQLIRYDARGNGLSDWDTEDISFEAFVHDLEQVADALELERFPLLGISQGAAVSIEYACRHPERVSKLILIGGYAAGWRHLADDDEAAERAATITLVRHGWGKNNPAYRQIFSHSFFPEGTPEEIDHFNFFQRLTTSAENAARFLECFADIDVRDRLAQLNVPTLVIHSRRDQRVSMERALELAGSIAGAQLVTLDSSSHTPLAREPAFEEMMREINKFLAEETD